MTTLEVLSVLTIADYAAVTALFLGWKLLSLRIESETAKTPSVTVLMIQHRREWMRQMLTRDPRIFDATILGSLRQSTTFLASTTVIAIGGALALIGNIEQFTGVAQDLGVSPDARAEQIKLVIIVVILTEAFLKFLWSNRIFGYCAVVMAAVPNDPSDPIAAHRAAQAAELNIRAAWNFNRGLRALYLALSTLAWLIGPIQLAVASLFVFWVIWSREFRSIPHRILRDDQKDKRP
ncbi:DUF599 domain-containing protein [Palleronia caenipelagi]|uniref:DUF599 domain-containing protein n=1 Tax=Palleronia caenipelagi TaxID=2489174 RepID=A0A547Q2P1_9RHOB|nr:DUF599 domain-containing protein [Palleronia caenipelagi]TRD20598.1 DUF599 domain-containing protein [Palleronia caenipelagi]